MSDQKKTETEKIRSLYHDVITEQLEAKGRPELEVRHVEAYIRLAHPTLDGLSREEFSFEVDVAIDCLDHQLQTAGNLDDAEALADDSLEEGRRYEGAALAMKALGYDRGVQFCKAAVLQELDAITAAKHVAGELELRDHYGALAMKLEFDDHKNLGSFVSLVNEWGDKADGLWGIFNAALMAGIKAHLLTLEVTG